MTTDCKHHPIETYINQSAVGKIPRDAPRQAWKNFHKKWQTESLTAYDLAANVWRGYSFAPVFAERKVKRDFKLAWHIGLDFDCADERAEISQLMEDDIINYFSSFIYYTPSSKPPAYKSRVVFVFDKPISDVDQYEEILDAFAWWFPDTDQSTQDAARFFYGSKGAKLEGNWSVLPLKSATYIVDEYHKAVPKKKKSVTAYKPKKGDEKDVADALTHIPKKLDYKAWLAVLMAIHSAFPNERGIQLCDSWSPGYDGEIEDKFDSFDRTKRNGITLRTLFKLAQDNGWKPKHNGSLYKGNKRSYDFRSLL